MSKSWKVTLWSTSYNCHTLRFVALFLAAFHRQPVPFILISFGVPSDFLFDSYGFRKDLLWISFTPLGFSLAFLWIASGSFGFLKTSSRIPLDFLWFSFGLVLIALK